MIVCPNCGNDKLIDYSSEIYDQNNIILSITGTISNYDISEDDGVIIVDADSQEPDDSAAKVDFYCTKCEFSWPVPSDTKVIWE